MSVLAILNTAVLFILVIVKKRRKDDFRITGYDRFGNEIEMYEPDDDIVKRRRLATLKILALLAGTIPLILFLILENIRLPIVWITRWTPLIGAFFIIHMVLLLVHFVIKKRIINSQEDEEEYVEEYRPSTEGSLM